MHSLSTRFNAVLYNMMGLMVIMGGLNFLDGKYNHTHEVKNPQFELLNIDHFTHDRSYYNEDIASF